MAENISVTKCAKYFMLAENNQNFGTKIHKYIEKYLKTRTNPIVNSEDEKRIFLHFKEFLKDHPYYEFIEAEKNICYRYKNKNITGKIDALFKHKLVSNEYIIVDWKIMKDLDFEKNKKYWFIMNIYCKILQELMPNTKIKMFLVLLHQHRNSYILIPCSETNYSLKELLDLSLPKHV